METPETPLPERIARLREIFDAALEYESSMERAEFLKEACGDDSDLKDRLESMFAKHEDPSGFLDHGSLQSFLETAQDHESGASDEPVEEELPFRQLGEFRLIRKLGAGGMGTVYEAEQLSLKRRVALKVLPAHLSVSDDSVRKFHREAEAGGRQSHAGIVAVHAVGKHKGTHYIAQELVAGGNNLSERLDELKKTREQRAGYLREAAQLVVAVADALQHAHERGVIHRDIKPSNVLLDAEGHPKVTDFGLAKVEDALALSRTGDFAGTPYYMSPEQAMSRRIGIDHRTDIYSLGVTLYEMLTLQRPFDGETSQEVLKKVVLQDPPQPQKVNPRIPRDLSTICLKAMDKLPEKRYQSMREFADDLCRFVSGDAILARTPGLRTRMWKRVKRNPVASGAVGVAVSTVLVSAIVVPWVMFYASPKETDRKIEEERASLIERFLKKAFDPKIVDDARIITAMLDEAIANLDLELADAPEAEISFRIVLGDVYHRANGWKQASDHYKRALELSLEFLGEQHPETLSCRFCQANNYYRWMKDDEAESALRKYLSLASDSLGEGHADVFKAEDALSSILIRTSRCEKGIQRLRTRYDYFQEKQGEHGLMSLKALNRLAIQLASRYDPDGIDLLRTCVKKQREVLGSGDSDTVDSMFTLASNLEKRGEYIDYCRLQTELFRIFNESRGPEDRETLKRRIWLAEAIDRTGKYEEAEEEYREVLSECERILGPADQDICFARFDLAVFLTKRGRLSEAERFHREALRARKQACPGDQSIPWSMHCLAETLRLQGQEKYDEARELHWEGLQESRNQGNQELQFRFLGTVARLFEDMDDHDEAENYLDRAIAITKDLYSDQLHPRNAKARLDKGCFLNRQRRYNEAATLLSEALEIFKNTTPKHYNRYVAASAYGEALAGQDEYESAETHLLDGHDGLVAISYAYYADEGTAAIERLITLYQLWDENSNRAALWQDKLDDHREIKDAMARGDYSLLPVPPEEPSDLEYSR